MTSRATVARRSHARAVSSGSSVRPPLLATFPRRSSTRSPTLRGSGCGASAPALFLSASCCCSTHCALGTSASERARSARRTSATSAAMPDRSCRRGRLSSRGLFEAEQPGAAVRQSATAKGIVATQPRPDDGDLVIEGGGGPTSIAGPPWPLPAALEADEAPADGSAYAGSAGLRRDGRESKLQRDQLLGR